MDTLAINSVEDQRENAHSNLDFVFIFLSQSSAESTAKVVFELANC